MKKKGKIVGTFVDHKVAFPSVNIGKLWRVLRNSGGGQELIERIRELYEDTRGRVKKKERFKRNFLVGEGTNTRVPPKSNLVQPINIYY